MALRTLPDKSRVARPFASAAKTGSFGVPVRPAGRAAAYASISSASSG